MEWKVQIELGEQDRQLLREILDALLHPTRDCERCASTVAAMFSGRASDTPAERAEQPRQSDESKAAPMPDAAQEALLEEIRHVVVRLTAAGHKAKARDAVLAYAPSISELPADRLDEVLKRLQMLEASA
jgi:hypothetical protein|nr:MAG TPA: hypothetical protein [Caudoviricetes sp.]